MAATNEAIVELSLAHLGDASVVTSISSPTSKQERFAARYFASARNEILRRPDVPWYWAHRRVLLVLHDSADDDAELAGEWAFAWDIPSNVLKVNRIYNESIAKFLPGVDYQLYTETDGTKLILTNTDCVYLLYTYAETDPTVFSVEFDVALSYLLASRMAGPLIAGTKGIQLANALQAQYEIAYLNAVTQNVNQWQNDAVRKDYKPLWITDR